MTHPLEQKIVALRRRVRRMAAVYGLSIVAAAVLGTVAALGLIDYLLRLQDRGLRIIASLVVLGVLGVDCAIATSIGRSGVRLRDVDLALRVQRRFPDLDDRLVSAVEFLAPAGRRSDGRLGRASPGGRRRDHGRDRAARFRRRCSIRGPRSAPPALHGRGVPAGRPAGRARSVGRRGSPWPGWSIRSAIRPGRGRPT